MLFVIPPPPPPSTGAVISDTFQQSGGDVNYIGLGFLCVILLLFGVAALVDLWRFYIRK